MSIKELLVHYANYDLWANERIVERLLAEADEVLDRPVQSSFPSIRATLMHIRNAENTWWGRITGTPTNWPANDRVGIEDLVVHSKRLRDLVVDLSEEKFIAVVSYKDLKGNEHRQPVWQILMHCCNHGTQHRGQVITMMRALGLSGIPANDLVVYQRSLG